MKYSIVALFLLASIVSLQSCKEQITSIGSNYFTDKISVDSAVIVDTNIIKLSNYVHASVSNLGTSYNVNSLGTTLFIGQVNDPLSGENVQSWGLFRFAPMIGDSLNHLDSVRLLLRLIPYNYGPDTTNTLVSFSVYAELTGKITDSTTALSQSDLHPLLGTFSANMSIDSSPVIAIKLDTGFFAHQDLTLAGLVVVPTPGAMNTIRAIATSLTTTSGFAPLLEYHIHAPDSAVSYRSPTVNFHLVQESTVTPKGEFSLRGSLSRRELFQLNLNRLSKSKDSLGPFSTVNSAQLILHLDPRLTRHSASTTDTAGPPILQLAATFGVDSTPVFLAYGSRDLLDPTTYRFELRTAVEQWLRDSTKNFGLILCAGDVARTFGIISQAVDDYTINWWTFYDFTAADPTKRPSLFLTHSILR